MIILVGMEHLHMDVLQWGLSKDKTSDQFIP